MKLTNTLLALGLAVLPAGALALDGDGKDDTAALIQKLGNEDYKVRREAFKKLEALGGDARAALEAAAKSDDAEVRWNASRLLDRLDDSASPRRAGGGSQSGGRLKEREGGEDETDNGGGARRQRLPADFGKQMQELERRLEEIQRQFDHDGFRFFRTEPFGLHSFDQGIPFQGFDDGGTLELGPGSSFSRSTTTDGKSESVTIKVDANGHVTAEQTKDGQTTKMEADSIEAFSKEHPDLLRIGGKSSVVIRPLAPGRFKVARPDATGELPKPKADTKTKSNRVKAPAAPFESPDPAREVPAAKPRLGVELAPVAPEIAEYLELDGASLQIVRVLDEMPAARRGLKARDILLEVNGVAVHDFDDVVKALENADPEKVPLVVLRRGQKQNL